MFSLYFDSRESFSEFTIVKPSKEWYTNKNVEGILCVRLFPGALKITISVEIWI